jgi:DNA polymerase/3'-5' exonuclease PolX
LALSISNLPLNNTNDSRRGAAESDEIEVLVTHTDYQSDQTGTKGKNKGKAFLEPIVGRLQFSGYITDTIVHLAERYDGIAQLPVSPDNESPLPHRRIKFRLVPYDNFVLAQLHYTGSQSFLTHCREIAAKKGYKLDLDRLEKNTIFTVQVFGFDGLQYMYNDEQDKRENGEEVLFDSEEDFFAFLGIDYVPPHQRNWY